MRWCRRVFLLLQAGSLARIANRILPKQPNPVLESAEFAYKATNLVQINVQGVNIAAKHILQSIRTDAYSPRTWRTHPLHICPHEPHDVANPHNKLVLDWIFLISSLNFSFWSEKEGTPERYGVEWRGAWESNGGTESGRKVWTGYWSLVAALDRALADDGIPITNPSFYSSEARCPDSLIEYVFRPAKQSAETIPLLRERIAVMRQVGGILCDKFNGSYQGFLDEFHRRYNNVGTALDLVKMVAETFPSFRDETCIDGRKVYIWKRAQILVAETWAAFYPPSDHFQHPIFPGPRGAEIQQLTMFADYRVPQILHHLRILSYPPALTSFLHTGKMLPYGSQEEVSLRAASIVAVEQVRKEILRLQREEKVGSEGVGEISSVLIDFYLWDLAKRIEIGQERINGISTAELVPVHRTRSIWY
ncbi:hypothetical protein AMATHDRAFT_137901 [Amanita thiersii Skay4041]|uniref:Queuosine 5'-phosphate N-glycosylase/hydrolase n=1 Tax=Amanita thiersii Skay4041 TaxID=703135 RepID=A0A2A9NZF6_9AGAR|nr:hypothetical protein AMATHDRAFT_137901 [Amanita thiersii Skay4041]